MLVLESIFGEGASHPLRLAMFDFLVSSDLGLHPQPRLGHPVGAI